MILVQDAPTSRLDLLICRNTLMYFNSETQNRILSRFSYALNPNRFLFLGKAEMRLIHSSLFSPVELKHRIFTKLGQVHLHEHLSVFAQNDAPAANHDVSRNIRLQEIVLEAESPPKVVIDAGGVTAVRKLESDMLRARHEVATANEGLQTINEELRHRTDELNSSNGFLNSILSSLRGVVAVVDHNINVTIWNRMAEDLWACGRRK